MSGGPELFYTRARANEGVRLPLHAPDGSPTDHWLQVRHVWSDAFQAANDEELAKVAEVVLEAKGDEAAIAAARRDAKLRLCAALVADWSFDQPCTFENVLAFLREAPQIAKVLDTFAADNKRFFGNGSTSSTAGSSRSASSASDSPTGEP